MIISLKEFVADEEKVKGRLDETIRIVPSPQSSCTCACDCSNDAVFDYASSQKMHNPNQP